MKVTVIGGGSTYTPELISGFLEQANRFPLQELWLMDIDAARLEIVGGFAQRMVAAQGSPFQIVLSTNRREAIRGARYVIAQLRVGQMPARREDEYLGQRHGLIGQETTGVGGMAKALRTIPVILDIAQDMRELAPGALLCNFTNPSGLVTEALARHAPDISAVGLCNAAITAKMTFLEKLADQLGPVDTSTAHLDALGLNHLTWIRGFTVAGQDFWPQVFTTYLDELQTAPEPPWDPCTVEMLGMLPNYYLKYYYHTRRELAAQKHWPPSRAEEVMEIEAELLRQYADPARSKPPADLIKRGGAYYSTLVVQMLNAHHNDLGQIYVANVPHRGAVPGWPEDWVLELPCRVNAAGVHPLPAEPLPTVCFGLLAQVKTYELLTVEAAVHRDRQAAYQAMLAHPLGPSAEHIQLVLEDMMERNRQYLPQFEQAS